MASERTNTKTMKNGEGIRKVSKQQQQQQKKSRFENRDDDQRTNRPSSSSSGSRTIKINKPSQNIYGGTNVNASQIMGKSTTNISFPVAPSAFSSSGVTVQSPAEKEQGEKNGDGIEKTTTTTNEEGNSNLDISSIIQQLSQFIQLQQAQLGKSKEGKYECKNIRALFINNKFDSLNKPTGWNKEKREAYDELERIGSEKDRMKMQDLFERQLGIELDCRVNITSARLEETIENFKDVCKEEGNKHDGLVVIIGTHGGEEASSLLMEDLVYVHLWRDIIFKFSREQFPEFEGPKIFLVNACREDKTTIPVPKSFTSKVKTDCSRSSSSSSSRGKGKLNLQDILVGLSTNTMDFSYRTPKEGSLYLHFIYKVLSQELENRDETSDFKVLLDSQVSPKVAEFMEKDSKKQQVPVSISLLFKTFHFKKQNN